MSRNNYPCKICQHSFRFKHALQQHYVQCNARYQDMMRRRGQVNQQRQQRNQNLQSYQRKQEQQRLRQIRQRQQQNWSRPDRQPLPKSTNQSRQDILRQKNIQQQYAEQKRMQLMRRKRFEENQRRYNPAPQRQQQQQQQRQPSFQDRRRQQMLQKQRYAQQQANLQRQQQMALARRQQPSWQNQSQQRQQKQLARQQRYERQVAERERHQRRQNYQQRREQQILHEQQQRRRERERMMRERNLMRGRMPQQVNVEPAAIVPYRSVNPERSIVPARGYGAYGSGNNTDLFAQLLKGKRVVIVGPSSSLTGKGRGDFIEGFDLVVRTNKSFRTIPAARQGDIGKRLDILYNNMNITDSPGENNFDPADLYRRGVQYVCSPYPPVDPFRNDIIRFAAKNRGLLPFHHIDSQQYGRMIQYLQSRPFTGTCAILDLMKFDIKELHITGIDFYKYGYYKEYQKKKLTQQERGRIRNNGIHKTEPQIKLLRYTLVGNKKVTMDPVLDWILFGPYRTIMKKISEKTHLFKNGNNEFKSFLDSTESIMVIGTTGNVSWAPETNVVVKLNLKRGITAKNDIVFFNGVVERQLKENPQLLPPESVKYIISFKKHKLLNTYGDKVIIVNPKFLQSAHQFLKKIDIKSISSELFAMLLLVHCRQKNIFTAGINLRSNKNRMCNAIEEDTLFKYMTRINMVNGIY